MKPFIGLAGVRIAAIESVFNDQVTSIAPVDIRGDSPVDDTWNSDQFYFWRVFQAVGQPLVIVPC